MLVSSSSSSSLSPSSKSSLPPLLPAAATSASSSTLFQSVSSSTQSTFISPRQHEREALSLASASLRATRSPSVPLDFPTADEIRDALQTRMAKISSLSYNVYDDNDDATGHADSEVGGGRKTRHMGESKDATGERGKEEEEEAWSAWSSLSAGQQADVLGIPKSDNPYMHATFSLMRIHPRLIALRNRQLLPPLYTPPLTLGISTQRSTVAAALDRLSFPAELMAFSPSSSSSSSSSTTPNSSSTSILRSVYSDMKQYQKHSQGGGGEEEEKSGNIDSRFNYGNNDAIAAEAALHLSESSAAEILSSLCRLIGVNDDAPNKKMNTTHSENSNNRDRAMQLSNVLLPRVRALAAAAVSASVLHHFAGVVCAKLGSIIAPSSSSSSSVGHFGLEDAVTFLDSALSELLALRASQRVKQQQQQQQQQEEEEEEEEEEERTAVQGGSASN